MPGLASDSDSVRPGLRLRVTSHESEWQPPVPVPPGVTGTGTARHCHLGVTAGRVRAPSVTVTVTGRAAAPGTPGHRDESDPASPWRQSVTVRVRVGVAGSVTEGITVIN